jgi:hypothetical protein
VTFAVRRQAAGDRRHPSRQAQRTGGYRAEHHPQWLDAPTFAGLGRADYRRIAWAGVFVPAGTPAAVPDKLQVFVYAKNLRRRTLALLQR